MDAKEAAEVRRKRFRQFMAARGLKVASWTKAAGASSGAIYNFLNGHSDSLTHETLDKLASAIGESVGAIVGDGDAPAAGTWGPVSTRATTIYPKGIRSARSLRLTIDQEVTPDQASRIWAILDETK